MTKIETTSALNWDVAPAPVFVNNENVSNFKAIVRNDSGSVLDIKNQKYRIFTNQELTDLSNSVSKITGFSDITFQEIFGGRIVLSYLKNSDKSANIGGFPIKDYLVIGNSFNGQTGLFLGSSSVIIRCTNSFGRIFKNIRIRHTESLSNRVEELIQIIEEYKIEKQKMFVTMENFTKVPVDQKIIDDCINYVFKLDDQEKLEKELSTRTLNKIALLNGSIARETNEVGKTLWGMFNGFTHFTTHVVNQKNGGTIGNLFGGKNEINQRAFEFANTLI